MCIVKQNWVLKDIFITYVSLWKGIYLAAKSLNSNIMIKKILTVAMLVCTCSSSLAQPHVNDGTSYLMNQALDMSTDFLDLSNTLFFADHLESFDVKSGEGLVNWKRGHLMPRQAFNTNGAQPRKMRMLDFPFTAYENDPNLKFKIDFVTPRTVRIRMLTTPVEPKVSTSIMLAKEPGKDESWKVTETENTIVYAGNYGTVQINKNPWRVVLKDKTGRILSQTVTLRDADSTQVKYTPFSFIKRGSDNARRINPVFTLTADEMIFGCGESATGLNKVGQKVNLFVTDPQGPETDQMYKPIPFFMSNRGYGMFMHTSAPVTCDFGATYIGLNKMFMGDENLDLFVFFGEPKDILDEYTDLVGKPGMPPLWSFGTWMSRITYFSEKEGYDVAANIRKNKYPCDVIHFDTGWFGSQILVAPLLESGITGRTVYLPEGKWIDYQTEKVYEGGWHRIEAGSLPIIMLVRDGSVLPHLKLAQSTSEMDWSKMSLKVYSADKKQAEGLICLPTDNRIQVVKVDCAKAKPQLLNQVEGTSLSF